MKTKTPEQLVPGDVLVAKKGNTKATVERVEGKKVYLTGELSINGWFLYFNEIETSFHLPALPQSAPKLNNVVIRNDNEQTAKLIKAFWEGQGVDMNIEFRVDMFYGVINGLVGGFPNTHINTSFVRILTIDNIQVTPEVTQPKYRPYTFEDREEFRELWLVNKGGEHRVTQINDEGFNFMTYQHAFENCTHLDGTPFGKLIEG